jgi:hypothetical protein
MIRCPAHMLHAFVYEPSPQRKMIHCPREVVEHGREIVKPVRDGGDGRPILLSGRSTQPWFFPWLALIETSEREQDLTSLPPQRGLIAAQPVEGIGRQVGKSDKGTCEVVRLIGRLRGRLRVSIETTGDFVFVLPLSADSDEVARV